jgi:NAD(P)H-flavin reductase
MTSMHIGEGLVKEITLLDGSIAARILCASNLIPTPGQYLLAHADGSDAPLPVPVFPVESNLQGFLAAPPLPAAWNPGTHLHLRGPLGHGFALPMSARRVALVAWDDYSARLAPLMNLAYKQEAAVTLVSDTQPDDLPLQVEVQPFSALDEVTKWADFIAMDVMSESLPQLRERFGSGQQARGQIGSGYFISKEMQVLISTPMPCGGVAECGVCAVHAKHTWKMACKDGPVFALNDLI